MHPHRPFPRRLALLALLAWTAFAFSLEFHRSEWLLRHDPFLEERPSTWRITSRPVRRMERFAAAAKSLLPAGSRVAVTDEPGPEPERFFRYLWLIYFLPGIETRLANGPSPDFPADFWIAYGTRLEDRRDPRLAPILTTPEGAVYKVLR